MILSAGSNKKVSKKRELELALSVKMATQVNVFTSSE